jgi:hypothetical protein
MTIHVGRETETERIESWDHATTTEPLGGLASISTCTACGKAWPARFGAGSGTVRIVPKGGET